MLKAFELKGDSGAELPEPDAVIVANDAGYEVPTLNSGQQTIGYATSTTENAELSSSRSSLGRNSTTSNASSSKAREREPGRGSPGRCRQSPPVPPCS